MLQTTCQPERDDVTTRVRGDNAWLGMDDGNKVSSGRKLHCKNKEDKGKENLYSNGLPPSLDQ